MTQAFFDPTALAAGDGLSTPGFPFSVIAGAFTNAAIDGTRGSFDVAAGSGRNAMAYEGVALSTDHELFIHLQNSSSNFRVACRIDPNDSAGTFYQVRSGSLDTVVNGTLTSIATVPSFTGGCSIRMRVSGSSPTVVSAKVWADGSSEPASWSVQVSDNTAALQGLSGYSGLTPYNGSGYIDAYGVGTAGDSAPTSAVTSITPAALASASAMGQPTVQQAGAVAATGLVSASAIASPAITQTTSVQAGSLVSASAIQSPIISPAGAIEPAALVSTGVIGQPSINQTSTLGPASLTSSSTIQSPAVAQTSTILAASLLSASTIGSPTLSSGQAIQAAPLSSPSKIGAPAISGYIRLQPNPLVSTSLIGYPTIVGNAVIYEPDLIAIRSLTTAYRAASATPQFAIRRL